MERLGVALLIFSSIGIALYALRAYQRARAGTGRDLPISGGQVSLLVFVSAHCGRCPAQKEVVAKLAGHYPRLRVEMVNVETEPEQARKLGVMTVPTTLVRSPQGAVVHINNGFTALAKLDKQIGELTEAAA